MRHLEYQQPRAEIDFYKTHMLLIPVNVKGKLRLFGQDVETLSEGCSG